MSDVQIAVIDQQDTQIVLAVPGVQGATGSSIPSGGTTDQVLRKNSSTDYDANWAQVTSAMIANGTIVNDDINNSAAIAGTKISPDFGGQAVTTTGQVSAARVNVTNSTPPSNGIYLPSANNVAISTGGSGRLFVDASGNVGIGTSSLTSGAGRTYLTLGGTTLGSIALKNASNAEVLYIQTGSASVDHYMSVAGYQAFWTNNQERLRITSAGLVGVGTSSPGYALDTVASSGSAVAARFRGNGGANNNTQIRFYGNNAATDQWAIGGSIATSDTGRDFHIYDLVANANRLAIDSSGRVGIGTSSPGELLTLNSNGTTGTAVRLENTSAGGYNWGIYSVGSAASLGPVGSLAFRDSTNGATRLVIDSSGLVGIGTTTPSSKLVVEDSAALKIAVLRTATAVVGMGVESGPYVYSDGALQFRVGATAGGSADERARIDTSGRLLVGTSSTFGNVYHATTATIQAPLQVRTATNDYNSGATLLNYSASGFAPVVTLGLSKNNSAGSNTVVASDDELGYLQFVGNDGTNFRTAAWIAAQVDGTPGSADMPGRLVFSTTKDGGSSPLARLRISNTGAMSTSSSGNGIVYSVTAGAGTATFFIAGNYSGTEGTEGSGTTSFYVWSNGNVQNTNNSYTAISDIKLKENIVDANSQWDDIKALQVRNYNLKEGQTHKQIGLIAQEVEPISPGLIYESPDRDAKGNDLGTVTKSVNYSVLYMKAVKALQEAMERIEALETKVAALESA